MCHMKLPRIYFSRRCQSKVLPESTNLPTILFFYILGSDDLSAKLWDVSTGQCIYGIQTHTCAAVKFDEQKLVTGSFDNTVACWEWSSGAKTQHFRGHSGAGMLKF